VTLADVQTAAGERVAADLCAKGQHVSFVHCDTTDWQSSAAAFKHAASFGPRKTLDVAILNAGVTGDGGSIVDQVLAAPEPFLESDVLPAQPSRPAVAVNYLGVYDGCWLALYYMRLPAKAGPANLSKSLIMTGSLASYGDMPFSQDYGSSKCTQYHPNVLYNSETNLESSSWCPWYLQRPPPCR
jgi:NAD(P)-dependent dehydrogenase (short-subunit alcohol dehydrogenase family)